MKDEWNLKDCKKYAGRGYFRGDIEILHQKLIDDVNNSVFIDVGHDDIIDIINKRFGVD